MLDKLFVKQKLEQFLQEDIGYQDITTDNLPFEEEIDAIIIAKEECVVCGIEFAKQVFHLIDDSIEFDFCVNDGHFAEVGEILLEIKGNGKSILKGERVALNILQRLSGISTNTQKYVKELKGTKTKILDTRKTTPGFRAFEKYAVKVGGGYNHRFALYDMVMLKDNHIVLAGGIRNAVEEIRKNVSPMIKIEVEVSDLEQFKEALELDIDVIMLDNMSIEDMRIAVEMNYSNAKLEASGNITLQNIRQVAETGVDFISSGALIHSAKWVDLSLRFFNS